MQFIKKFIREDEGQGMVEYGIILGLVSVFAILALGLVGTDLVAVFTDVTNKLGTLPGV